MERMDTKVKQLDMLPMVKHYIGELGLHELFDKYVPNTNGSEIRPAQVLCVMVMNIVAASKPLYHVDEWLTQYLDGKAEDMVQAGKYNDDRLARSLDKLFYADRHSLMTEASSSVIKVHELEVERIHNDSTTVSFSGAYNAFEAGAVKLDWGYNKDHRPDYKQIVFGLNITEDGHVPLSYQLFDGNRSDVTTHVPNWDGLREFLGREDFIYTADSKLCSTDTLEHIALNNGKFITIMPKNRKEVGEFYEKLQQGDKIDWQLAYQTENSRKKGCWITYQFYEGEKSREGYRIVWIHSSSKEIQDRKTRERRIVKAEEGLEELSGRLNKYYLKTRDQIKQAVDKVVKKADEFIEVEIIEEKTVKKVKVGRGRRGLNSKYKDQEHITYQLRWWRNDEAIKKAERSDGVFPLIDNTDLPAPEVLKTYKKQPFLEKRFYTKKSVLEVAPVFLKKPRRIEAMMFLYFIALMIVSLIERNIRKEMVIQQVDKLRILPSRLSTKTPTWNNLCNFFQNVHLALITKGERILQSTIKGVTELHCWLLELLKVPRAVYDNLCDGWWIFNFQ